MKIEEKIDRYLSEIFSSAEDALGMVNGPTTSTSINKIMKILNLTIDDQQPSTSSVIKRLKSIGLEDDEINEIRDIYVKVYKNTLDRLYKKYFSGGSVKTTDVYTLDKNLFGLYKFDDFIFGYSDKAQPFIKELEEKVNHDFKYTYENRVKEGNRKYGKMG